MALGRWLKRDRAQAYRGALIIGLITLGLFGALRALGGFGNLRSALSANWIDIFNVVKYPPAIVFLLLTLAGVDLLLLFAFSRMGEVVPRGLKPLQSFSGRVRIVFSMWRTCTCTPSSAWLSAKTLVLCACSRGGCWDWPCYCRCVGCMAVSSSNSRRLRFGGYCWRLIWA